jgi:Transposase DDE domain
MILALIVDGAGRPICTEMWPGNTADVATLPPVIDRLRQRFSIGRVCVVADRGMISAATIEGLEARKLEYILGARERSDAIARKIVLENEDPFAPLLVERKAAETQLFVKQVKVEGKRYIVCRNEAEAVSRTLSTDLPSFAEQKAAEPVCITGLGWHHRVTPLLPCRRSLVFGARRRRERQCAAKKTAKNNEKCAHRLLSLGSGGPRFHSKSSLISSKFSQSTAAGMS